MNRLCFILESSLACYTLENSHFNWYSFRGAGQLWGFLPSLTASRGPGELSAPVNYAQAIVTELSNVRPELLPILIQINSIAQI